MALTKITPQMFDTSATAHDLNVDNGTFVVDGSASRVGIGTATPSTLLHVNGISTFAGNILPSADSTHDIGTNGNRFANAYFDTMYGTVGTVAQPNITSVGTLTSLAVGGTIASTPNSGTLTIKAGRVDSTNNVRLEASGTTSTYLEYRGYLGHRWDIDTTEKMVLNGTGLGIAAIPMAWYANQGVLQIGPQMTFHSETTSTTSQSAHMSLNAQLDTDASWEYILSSNKASNYYQYQGTHNWRVAAAGTAGDDITWTTAMSLDNDGDLTVAGNILSKTINITGDNHDLIISSNDHEVVYLGNRGSSGTNLDKGYLRMKSESTNTVVIDTAGISYFNGGTLAVGTTSTVGSSAEKFVVSGTGSAHSRFAGNSDSYSTVYIKNSSTTANTNQPFLTFQDTGGNRGNLGLRYSTAQLVIQGHGGVGIAGGSGGISQDPDLFVNTSGLVGIGETSPSAKLHVKKTAASTQHYDAYATAIVEDTEGRLQIVATDGGSNASALILTNEEKHWGIVNHGPGQNNTFGIGYYATSSSGTDIADALSNPFTITTGGKVGIGDSSPSQELNVAGNIMLEGNNQYLYLTNVGTGNSGIYVRGNTASSYLRSHSTGKFTWEVTGSQKMELDANGQLGIGKSPIRMLDIKDYGSGDPGIRLESASYAQDVITLRNNDGRVGFGGDAITVLQNGKVGIGVTGPSAKLQITADNNSGNNVLLVTRPDNLSYTASEPFCEILTQSQDSTAGRQYGGVGMMGDLQAHLRFQVGNSDSWDGSGAKKWQLRCGVGAGTDQLSIYSWTAGASNSGNEVVAWASNGTQTNHVVAGNYVFLAGSNHGQCGIGPLNTSYFHFIVQSGGPGTFYFGQRCEANGGFHTYSDERLKKEITPISDAITKVKKMNGVTFKWTDPENRGGADTGKQFGVTAQNMLEVDSELPTLNKDPLYNVNDNVSEDDEYYTMDYSRITPFLIEAIKEQQAQIEALQAEVKALKGE